MVISSQFSTAIGWIRISVSDDAVVEVQFLRGEPTPDSFTKLQNDSTNSDLLKKTEEEITRYLSGGLHEFTVPVRPSGTPFQQQVWSELRKIPFGETRSYKEVAIGIGNPTASRAVGLANGKNPIPILIPCHRVIGADGSLTGFSAGLPIKKALLAIECASGASLFGGAPPNGVSALSPTFHRELS